MRSAVPEPDPNQPHLRSLSYGKVEEILVFTDEDHVALSGEAPDLGVGSLREPKMEDVLALRALRAEETDECDRELVIDQELHETWSTV